MQFETLDEWLAWQDQLHPKAIDLGLERVSRVFTRLHPEKPVFKIITIAGTNGKGSSAAMLNAILLQAGFKVGLYTSPHLVQYNERIRINDVMAEDAMICDAFDRINQARQDEAVSLTYFEFGTLAALDLFYSNQIDVAILEVGLGGRLDAVNIVDPDISLITAIDLDHCEWLGDNREQIAIEKGGIMRAHKPTVICDNDIPSSLMTLADALKTPVYCLHRDFDYVVQNGQWQWQSQQQVRSALPRPAMAGDHQLQNAAGVLMVLMLLQEIDLPVKQSDIRFGLLSARISGRYDYYPNDPAVILDVAHNPAAASCLAKTLSQQPHQGQTYLVIGMLADKDSVSVIRTLGANIDKWFICDLSVNRALTARKLAETVKQLFPDAKADQFKSASDAFIAAKQQADADDRIVVTGSFYTVAEVKAESL